jgi:hypothetical protein
VTRGAQVSVQAAENFFLQSQNKCLVDPGAKKFFREGKFFLLFGLNYLQSLNENSFTRSDRFLAALRFNP